MLKRRVKTNHRNASAGRSNAALRRVRFGVVGLVLSAMSAPSVAQQIQVVQDIPGKFQDISSSQPLNLGDDEETVLVSSIGNFAFPSGQVIIANNGGVAFRLPPNTDLAPVNQPIPSEAAFGGGQAILVYWDDLDDKDGDVYVFQEDERLIIQWHNRPLGDNPTSTARFQLQIPTDPGPAGIVAQLIFADVEQPGVEGGLSATIGYQDGGVGFGDFQWSFDTRGAVTNGMVLSLVFSAQAVDAVPAASDWAALVAFGVMLAAGTLTVRRRFDHNRSAA